MQAYLGHARFKKKISKIKYIQSKSTVLIYITGQTYVKKYSKTKVSDRVNSVEDSINSLIQKNLKVYEH